MNRNDRASQLGHNQQIIEKFADFKRSMDVFDSENIAELLILYFLPQILWSANFELVAEVIKEYGYESRVDQWKEELNK